MMYSRDVLQQLNGKTCKLRDKDDKLIGMCVLQFTQEQLKVSMSLTGSDEISIGTVIHNDEVEETK